MTAASPVPSAPAPSEAVTCDRRAHLSDWTRSPQRCTRPLGHDGNHRWICVRDCKHDGCQRLRSAELHREIASLRAALLASQQDAARRAEEIERMGCSPEDWLRSQLHVSWLSSEDDKAEIGRLRGALEQIREVTSMQGWRKSVDIARTTLEGRRALADWNELNGAARGAARAGGD